MEDLNKHGCFCRLGGPSCGRYKTYYFGGYIRALIFGDFHMDVAVLLYRILRPSFVWLYYIHHIDGITPFRIHSQLLCGLQIWFQGSQLALQGLKGLYRRWELAGCMSSHANALH